MPHIAHFILIDAPLERVFAFVADFRNLPRIQAQFQSVRLLTPRGDGVGARIEAKGAFHGLPLAVQMTIVQVEAPHLLVSDSTGGVTSHSVWRFSPVPGESTGGAARVRAALAIDYVVNLPGLGLLAGLVQRDLDALTIDALRRLKLLVETEATPPAAAPQRA